MHNYTSLSKIHESLNKIRSEMNEGLTAQKPYSYENHQRGIILLRKSKSKNYPPYAQLHAKV